VIAWARDVAAGAALNDSDRGEFHLYYGMSELLPNLPMIGLVQAHMEARPPVWTEAEQAFARGCQAEMGLPEAGLATAVIPPVPPTEVGASTDLGDVSQVTPLGVFGWPTVGLGTSCTPGRSPPAAACRSATAPRSIARGFWRAGGLT
jgi:aminobenzoyl-glutamate utilization protein B